MTLWGLCRVLGVAGILTGGILLQQKTAQRLRQELRTLTALTRSLAYMEGGVRMQLQPVPLLLQTLPRSAADEFFREVLRHLRSGSEPSLQQAWEAAIPLLPLRQEEREWVAALGSNLSQDADSVCRALLRTVQLLEQAADDRRRGLAERVRMYGALCFSGCFLLIFLLL